MAKDYYKILGVDRSADDKAIKQAFRRLAKKYHPDANKNDANAEARFKEINEAHEVLSDPQKRAMYDRFGTVTPNMPPPNTAGASPFGGAGGQTVDFSDLFNSIFGGRGGTSSPFSRAPAPSDIEQTVTITLQEAYTGSTRLITKGERTIRVSIPAGAADGTKVRLAGEGENGGDLYLVVKVEPDPRFQRDGDHLTTEVNVDWLTALLGGEVEVPTLSRPVKLKIPAGTQSGRKFRLVGKGMPVLKQKDKFGDLFARVLITVPERLTDEQRRAVENLRALF